MNIIFLYTHQTQCDSINQYIVQFNLPLSVVFVPIEGTINHKIIKTTFVQYDEMPIVFFYQDSLVLTLCVQNEIIKTTINWQAVQQRIVKAGKKSELLLKIAKITPNMHIVDGTAGFGIDSLILASTGAYVTMVEQNPLIFLMLYLEKIKMQQNKNWQKLLSRITIQYADCVDFLDTIEGVDMIYLDPMFPKESYKSLVNKNMQILQHIVSLQTATSEQLLFEKSIQKCTQLIIKRPCIAPYFANVLPVHSIQNDSIRFDWYESKQNTQN